MDRRKRMATEVSQSDGTVRRHGSCPHETRFRRARLRERTRRLRGAHRHFPGNLNLDER